MHSSKTIDKKRKKTKTTNKSSKKKKIIREEPEQKIMQSKTITETSKSKKEEMIPEADDATQKQDTIMTKEISPAVIPSLPNDILINILRNLNARELQLATRVNSHWRSTIGNPRYDTQLWKYSVLRSWGLADGDIILACFSWRSAFQKTTKEAIDQAMQAINEAESKSPAIILANLNLTVLPSKLFEIPKLQRLSLFGNCIEFLPKEIEKLASLTDLCLYRNHIVSIPSEIRKLSQLQVIALSYNKLTSIPDTICSIPSLKRLEIDHNQIRSLPEGLDKALSLRTLYLTGNDLTFDSQQSLTNLCISLPNLQDHDFYRL
eukprot:TRINITY_DN5218_c0_g1_i2.p1 TRINITY_DN5218_c0_g1~~TRINITY_DN5218_c0_g1_i2.p1  ORF type:complete len:320 (-),score=64.98 TRINITY_DN5218_c0_g1_i2:35-994(-)